MQNEDTMQFVGNKIRISAKLCLSKMAILAARLERQKVELQESEAFLASILKSTTDKVKVLDANGALCYMNGSGLRFLGLDKPAEVLGLEWAELWPEPERPKVRAVIAAVLAKDAPQRFEGYRNNRSSGTEWWDVVVAPMPIPKGPRRLVVVSRDVTERHTAEERQTLLVREVDHRAKNALAVALAVVRLAPRKDIDQFASGIEGRISSMARAHSILTKTLWSGADLRLLLEGELAAFSDRTTLTGPPAQLTANAAQPLSMLLHELITNAVKHGSLSKPEGRVHVTWNFSAADEGFCLVWSEQGGPEIAGEPQRKGFGFRLLKTLGEQQLGGRLQCDWLTSGLRVSLTLKPNSVTATRRI